MSNRHKHADLIHAWAEGAEIEFKYPTGRGWCGAECPKWDEDTEYRIKPEKKPDVVASIFIDKSGFPWIDRKPGNLMITLDGETGQLISAEVLK